MSDFAATIRTPVMSVVRDITDWSGVSLSAQVAAMFASGEQGVWYDPSNLSSMFQDSAGTIPVTALGQPVGRILDQSGRGNHATQAMAAARPLLQQDAYGKRNLAFNGTSSFMNFPAITPADGVMAWGVSGVLNASYQIILSGAGKAGYLDAHNGYWGRNNGGLDPVSTVPVKSRQAVSFLSNGTSSGIYADSSGSNGSVISTAAIPDLSLIGTFDGTQLFFTGNIYGMVIRSAHTTDAQAAQVRAYLAGQLGSVT